MGESQRAAGELEGEEEGRKKGEEGTGEVEKERCSGEEAGDMRGLVWRRHSSSSLFMLSLFFSVLSFSTDSCRLAFSSDSCLQGAEKSTKSHEKKGGSGCAAIFPDRNRNCGGDVPGDGEVHLDPSQQIFILLLQNLHPLLKEHVLLGLLKKWKRERAIFHWLLAARGQTREVAHLCTTRLPAILSVLKELQLGRTAAQCLHAHKQLGQHLNRTVKTQ